MVYHVQGLSARDALAAVLDDVGGQPLEQVGVCRLLAQRSEIARAANQAAAEMPVPDAIDQDLGRQRGGGVALPAIT